ncbi:hypothetical protein Har1130_03620 [Haloarcula sp. CBA1130]|uniref:hypothetical protein n=1 Tax=unclassified Haloarcula TaxID=2624677 RepID=UPI0012457991|nr:MULTISPECIES: hypothetical protein [unclassified Haloarcula]KAA9396914.1 hypothetical protein Har1129_01125 [Haloarcula sp. CBA1129]KAA9401875.1 hypothetical protein Har1130_03620 [Haloarcula sp. CBA1130]
MNLIDYLDESAEYDEQKDLYEDFARRALERDDLEEYYASASEDDILSSITMYDFVVQDHAEANSEDEEGGDDL